MKEPAANLEKFVIRLPEGMRDVIAAAAKDSGRSMNAEMVYRLQSSFAYDAGATKSPLQLLRAIAYTHGVLNSLHERLAAMDSVDVVKALPLSPIAELSYSKPRNVVKVRSKPKKR